MRMNWTIWAATWLVAATAVGLTAAGEDLKVLTPAAGVESPGEMITRYLNGLGEAALDRRAGEVEKLTTAAQVKERQEKMRAFFLEQLGAWPERTPLNAEVVGRRDMGDWRMEKVIFESRPRFHVTGVLYLPKTPPPYPAVLVPCGHAAEAKAYPDYQRISVLLARQGMAAFCFDPVGQGERELILPEEGKAALWSTVQHMHLGAGSTLLGINAASYFVWDGMRAIDYLVSREDIDGKRIGCTGQSGGGTQTSYLMALDDRIVSAGPACFLTSIRKVWETIGPQDAEQNIHGAVAAGMEHADYLIMRGPRPTMVLAATKDFFDIGGTRATVAEAKRIYGILGAADRVELTESESEHSFNPVLRAASARWMKRWLLDRDEAVQEPEWEVLKAEELWCTPAGQVAFLEGERSAFELNAELGRKLAVERQAYWEKTSKYRALGEVCKLAGIRLPADLPKPEVTTVGSVSREGYAIDKLVIKPEPGIVLPGLLFRPADGPGSQASPPAGAAGEMYLYLHGEGKEADAGAGGPIEKLVRAGHLVLAVDLRGMGETRPAGKDKAYDVWFSPLWRDIFRAYLLGKSFVGMRAEDVLVCGRFMAERHMGAVPRRLHLIAIGEAAVPALHAAAVHPRLFASVKLDRCLTTWRDVVRSPMSRNQLINVVHGALKTYDLPDLMDSLSANRMDLTNPLDALGEPLKFQEAEETQPAAGDR